MKKILLSLIILFCAGDIFPQKIRLAVIDLEARAVSLSTARITSDLVRMELNNTGNYIIVERGDIDSILKEQGLQSTGCTDTECAVKIGKLLSANKILTGSVSRLGEKFHITARVIDVESGVVEFAEKASADSEGDIDSAVSQLVKKLVKGIRVEKSKKTLDVEGNKISVKEQAIRDAKSDAKKSENNNWQCLGMGCGLAGVIVAAVSGSPDPPLTAVLGKSREYVLYYSETYAKKRWKEKMISTVLGCAVNGIGLVGIIFILSYGVL